MGRTVGALGPAPTTDFEGPAATMSAARDPATDKWGPAAEGDGPWHTRGL